MQTHRLLAGTAARLIEVPINIGSDSSSDETLKLKGKRTGTRELRESTHGTLTLLYLELPARGAFAFNTLA